MLPKVSFRSMLISIIIFLIAAMPIGLALARSSVQQSGELLTNSGFEQPYEHIRISLFLALHAQFVE